MKILNSKRNTVFLYNNTVFKIHKNPHKAVYEENMLNLLNKHKLNVPKIIKREANVLSMNYINGIPLPDYLEYHKDNLSPKELGEELFLWLSSYYKSVNYKKTKIIRGDINCRNFIVLKNNKIYGVDFEEEVKGFLEEDLGKLIIFLKNYNNTNKGQINIIIATLIKNFKNNYNLNMVKVHDEAEKEKQEMKLRRKG